MASQDPFQQAQTLLAHIPLLVAKLDRLYTLTKEGSAFQKLMDFEGSQFIGLAERIQAGEEPKTNKKISKFVTDNYESFHQIVQTINYGAHWCSLAHDSLEEMIQKSTEFDLLWNHSFTIDICKLFVQYSKFCYFVYKNKLPTLCCYSSCYSQFLILNDEAKKMVLIDDPVVFISSSFSIQFFTRVAQLITQIGQTMLQVFSEWPLLDWDHFNVFNRPEPSQKETCLPDIEHVCLEEIGTLREFVLYFHWPSADLLNEPQFQDIFMALLNDSKFIQITPSCRMKFKPGKRTAFGHPQRRLNLVTKLQDLLDFTMYDNSYLAYFALDIVSLASLGFYEVENSLLSGFDTSSADLLVLLFSFALEFAKNKREVQRAFIYNLTTVDLDFLTDLMQKFDLKDQTGLFEWISQIIDCLRKVSLSEFDSDNDYNFRGFILTIQRIFYQFNSLTTDHHFSYLHPLIAQLEVIKRHAEFAHDPVSKYFEHCPLQTLERFQSVLLNFQYKPHVIPSIMHLFELFSNSPDYSPLIEQAKQHFNASFQSQFKTFLQFNKINRFDSIFDPKRFANKESKTIWQIESMLADLDAFGCPLELCDVADEDIELSNSFCTQIYIKHGIINTFDFDTTSFIRDLKLFLKAKLNSFVFLKYSNRFVMTERNGNLFTETDFIRLIKCLGPSIVVDIDDVLTKNLARLVGGLVEAYQSLNEVTQNWFFDYKTNGKKWQNSYKAKQIDKALQSLIKIGVILQLRDLLRSASQRVTEETMPGATELLTTDDMIEILTNRPLFDSLRNSLKDLLQIRDIGEFFFFLGLSFNSNMWNDAHFQKDNEYIDYNLHLVPIAIEFLTVIISNFNTNEIKYSLKIFFNVLNSIVYYKADTKKISMETLNSFIIFIDLFPRYTNSIEYGCIAGSFPYNVITEAYRKIDKIHRSSLSLRKTKNKPHK